MKKNLIIVAAAVLAFAACSKVDTLDNTKKISFEVANYVTQTKAAEDPVALTETDSFQSKAWLHANGAETGTNFFGSSSNSYTETVTYNGTDAWNPTLEYFWPKGAGSYINFVSWYATNSKTPSNISEVTMDWGTSASPLTIVADDNILVADEAWRYSDNVRNNPTYGYRSVTEGVPTLFHHALAKVAFNLCLKTKTASDKTIWDVKIKEVTLKVGNNGYLPLVNEAYKVNNAPATGTQPWKIGSTYSTGSALTSANVGWSRPASGATLETIVEKEKNANDVTKAFEKPELTLAPVGATASNPVTNTEGFVEFLAQRTVLPQIIDGGVVTFRMKFEIKIYHAENGAKVGDAYSTEDVEIEETNLFALVDGIDNWKMNTKYIYNVTIDPVGKKVTFDPAVAAWNEPTATEQEIYPLP